MPTSKIKTISETIGKTIKGTIIKKSESAGPKYQVFIIFEDETFFEIYINSEDWNSIDGLKTGDAEYIREAIGENQTIRVDCQR